MRIPLIALTVMTASCGLFSSRTVEPVQLVNGFDFPLTITMSREGGSESAYEVPPGGRVGVNVTGGYTVTAKKADGTELTSKKAEFGVDDDACVEFYNPGGAANYVSEEIQYGSTTYTPKLSSTAGRSHVKMCVTWGLDVEKPPESISTSDQYAMSKTYRWLHLHEEGDWVDSIDYLLGVQEREPTAENKHLTMAWNIAIGVHNHDRDNPRLKALGPRFHQMCTTGLSDIYKGILAENELKKCLNNHAVLFPEHAATLATP